VKLYWTRNDIKNISGEMIDEAVTVPNKSYDMNNLSIYKVTLTSTDDIIVVVIICIHSV
jgi:hypothetical protein